ncbi:uncharacterized protein [Salminus brasiliensis]|uniref:uncharacterized protein n=1 Tax=Salminus brasiliensis TaxID=930266 RepID=UPI003B82E7B8
MEDIEKDGDSESIYMNVEDIEKNYNESKVTDSIYLNTTGRQAGSEAASEGRQVRSGNPAAVCLGLLCVLLLAVIVGLSIKHNVERDQLQNSYTNITLERDQLQNSYTNITLEKEQLQNSYTNITLEKEQLQNSYTNITLEKEQLQNSYTNITLEKEQLQNSYTNITLERDKLQSSYETVNMERGALLKQLTELGELEVRPFFNVSVACPAGWIRFMSSCYFVSSTGNTWALSRHDCTAKGADLVIINSREEQKFVSGLGKALWIGLTDLSVEGSWTWVDGTLLEHGYWKEGEPNNALHGWRDEDCAQPHNSFTVAL